MRRMDSLNIATNDFAQTMRRMAHSIIATKLQASHGTTLRPAIHGIDTKTKGVPIWLKTIMVEHDQIQTRESFSPMTQATLPMEKKL
jgi:hypothetical protein